MPSRFWLRLSGYVDCCNFSVTHCIFSNTCICAGLIVHLRPCFTTSVVCSMCNARPAEVDSNINHFAFASTISCRHNAIWRSRYGRLGTWKSDENFTLLLSHSGCAFSAPSLSLSAFGLADSGSVYHGTYLRISIGAFYSCILHTLRLRRYFMLNDNTT